MGTGGTHTQHEFVKALRAFACDDSGQAVTEYILLLSLALGGAVAISRGLMKAIDKFVVIFGAQLERDLKTGRAGYGTWSN